MHVNIYTYVCVYTQLYTFVNMNAHTTQKLTNPSIYA